MLYVYGITDQTQPPAEQGLRGAPLTAVVEGGLTAIVSEHDDIDMKAEEDELWAHEAVVEALMSHGAVLPMRLGSVSPDAAAVRALLREREGEFRRALDSVRGAVELGVRAAAPASAAPEAPVVEASDSAGPGVTYLLNRLSEKRQRDATATRIHDALRPLARRHTDPASAAAGGTLRAAYLVDREQVDAFAGRVGELQQELEGVSIACTGPWPPYSFTKEPA